MRHTVRERTRSWQLSSTTSAPEVSAVARNFGFADSAAIPLGHSPRRSRQALSGSTTRIVGLRLIAWRVSPPTGAHSPPDRKADLQPNRPAHGGVTSRSAAPTLAGDALAAVRHRGSHLQIIAAAGSGKTEVVSQRVADLLADGMPAAGIVAFTFTERAAAELKDRISERAEERLGRGALDQI